MFKITVDHIFHHVVRDPETARFEREVLGKLELLKEALEMTVKTIDQMIQQQNDMIAKVQKTTDLEQAIIQNQKDQAATIADLRAQLASAGVDPTKLQALGDAMDALSQKVDAEADQAATAITTGTQAAPAQ